MRLALFEPDIPQNTGTMIRMAACFGVPVDIIEPCGFIFDDKRLRRAGMDYLDIAAVTRHASWESFLAQKQGRLVLMTTKSSDSYVRFQFEPTDILLMGRESAGVPDVVHRSVDARVRIPMKNQTRSLNVAISAAIVLGEALRQTGVFADDAFLA